MGPDPHKGTASPNRRTASVHLRMPGLQGSGQLHRLETKRTRVRRKAVLRRLFRAAAGAVGRDSQDTIPCSRNLPPPELWHRGTIRRDLARHASLVELCVARGCSAEDANELVQEAHLRLFAYQRSASVRDPESLLRLIVINLSITYYHRELSRALIFENIEKLDKMGVLIDPAPDPERTLAAEQQLNSVLNLVSALSPRTCQIFVAQRGGYTYEEVAAAFVIKPRTVEKHVALATTALTDMMPVLFSGVRLQTMSKGANECPV